MSNFDRVRPRPPVESAAAAHVAPVQQDPEGKRALYSLEVPVPAMGSVTIECPSCEVTSVLAPMQALRVAVPSLHLPLIKKGPSSYMKCPSCGRRGWVKASIRI